RRFKAIRPPSIPLTSSPVPPSEGAPITATVLPSLAAQAQRLIDLDVPALAGLPASAFTDAAASFRPERTDALLALDPALAPPSALAPMMRRGEKPGFVVEDMTDVNAFAPTAIELPRDRKSTRLNSSHVKI